MKKAKEGDQNMEMDFLTATNATAATSSIFSFDQLDEFFQLSPLESFRQQEEVTLSSLLQEDVGGGGTDPVVIPSRRRWKERSRKGSTAPETSQSPNDALANDNSTDKKVIHRDIERLRRQEMASLYRSLRSHLPLELLKGKRSISDHIHQAVNYIRHQQNKIRVLSEKRDELKRRMESRGDSGELSEQTSYDPRDTVVIYPCVEGAEILINTSLRQGIPLSRILNVLMREGLNVIRANSAQMNERVIHSIHAEVEDQGNLDLAGLHQKLMNMRA